MLSIYRPFDTSGRQVKGWGCLAISAISTAVSAILPFLWLPDVTKVSKAVVTFLLLCANRLLGTQDGIFKETLACYKPAYYNESNYQLNNNMIMTFFM